MSDLQKSLVLAAVRLLINMPWVVAGAAAFYPSRRVSRKIILAALGAIALFLAGSNIALRLFLYGEHYYVYDQAVLVAAYGLMMFFFAWCYRLHTAALVYVFCLIQGVSSLVNQLSYMIVSIISPGTKISILSSMPYSLLMIALTLVCALLLYRFCRTLLGEAFETLEPKSIWQLCIVPVIFLLIFQIVHPLMEAFNGLPSVFLLLLFLLAAALLTYVVNIQAVLGSAKSASLRVEAEETQKLLTLQERSYQQLLSNIRQTRAERHDLRFHLSVIDDFVRKGDTGALTDYLAGMTDRLADSALHFCDNAAADAVIRHFVAQAGELGAACDCTAKLPAKTQIADVDLCVVLGNLLENAVHALCGQGAQGVLQLRCLEQERRVLIAVDNSLPEDFSGFREGIGLQSVRAVAEMYGGSAKLEAEGGVFRASVILHANRLSSSRPLT